MSMYMYMYIHILFIYIYYICVYNCIYNIYQCMAYNTYSMSHNGELLLMLDNVLQKSFLARML